MDDEQLEDLACQRSEEYMVDHTDSYNCENTKLETDNYNAGLEWGFEQGFIKGYREGEQGWYNTKEKLPVNTDSLYLVNVYTWDSNLHDFYAKYGFYIPTVCQWNGEQFIALDKMAYSNAININSCKSWKEIVPSKGVKD